MQKKLAIPLILFILIVLLACSIGYEGIVITDDEESIRLQTGTAIREMVDKYNEELSSSKGDVLPTVVEPTKAVQPTAVTDPIPVPSTSTTTEYSVTAQNFNCICQDTGTVTQEFSIINDQLHIGDMIFDKIDTNSYSRSWMGYYILVSGEGDNQTETQVEESRSSVVILTDTGYIMENYQGNNGSPCCINTFTTNK